MKSFQVTVFLIFCAISCAIPEQEEDEELFSRFQRFRDNVTYPSGVGTKVVGGTEALPHQFPYLVAIHVRNYEGGYDHFCGGLIYDASHIITAAHCVRGIHPNNFKVIAGEHEIFKDEGTEQYRDVEGYHYHPNYDPQIYDNDIAVIRLDWPLDLNPNIQPIRVPTKYKNNPPTARVAGWGSDGSSNEMQPKLLYVDLKIVDREVCKEAYKFVGEITEGMLCAGDENGGKGSCGGDSGGPLICKEVSEGSDEYDDGDNSNEYLCGIVSWGMIYCATPEYPSVFTDINNYLDWLNDNLPQLEKE